MTRDSSQVSQARHDLSRLLAPSAIALVGASSNAQVTSGQPLRYMKEFGYAGKLYPVNPKRKEVQGIQCYERVLAIPQACDVAVITVAAPHVPGILRECGIAHIPFAVVLSAGFEEIGVAGLPLQQQLQQAIADSGVRVVGPNSTGVVNLRCRAYCAQGGALADATLQPGPVAVVAQSGGVGLSMLSFIESAGIGVSYLVSSGNEIDLDVFDFADYLLGDPDVWIIALYLESSTDGRKMRALGRRALELGKPVVVLKAGNAGTARSAASSHTGRLTADYALFRTAFREGGYVEAGDIGELVDLVAALQGKLRPAGTRAALLTTSGGWGVMIAEQCEQHGLSFPPLAERTLAELRHLAPSYAALGNPVDLTPQGYKDQYASYNEITGHLLADPGIDLVIVRSATGSDIGTWANRLVEIAQASGKPVLVNWAPPAHRYNDVKQRLQRQGIPCFSYVGQIARVAAACVDFSSKLRRIQEVPGTPHAVAAPARATLELRGALGESAAMECLRAYGIAVAKGKLLRLDQLERPELEGFRFPVAVKVESAELTHKTEAGGVVLNVNDAAGVTAAARRILERTRAHAPKAVVNGILVQEMASGLEVILGAVSDPHFGPFVMFGIGGIFAEVMRDVSYRFSPVTESEAFAMIQEVRGRRLLDSVRGLPGRDVNAVAAAIVNLSRLITDHQHEISEIEINPLIVGAAGEGVTAADCLVTVKPRCASERAKS